jgi:hypothetical protein
MYLIWYCERDYDGSVSRIRLVKHGKMAKYVELSRYGGKDWFTLIRLGNLGKCESFVHHPTRTFSSALEVVLSIPKDAGEQSLSNCRP